MQTRRDFLRSSIQVLGLMAVPFPMKWIQSSSNGPHFFLQLQVSGGLDWSYLCDARPLEMTQKGKIQNYLKKEPTLRRDDLGRTTWVTELMTPLEPFWSDFSIINGMTMSTGFDGHTQNLDFYFSGNPFGGDIFVPLLSSPNVILDFIQFGDLYMNASNIGNSLQLSAAAGNDLAEMMKSAKIPSLSQSLDAQIASRYQTLSSGQGLFSRGVKELATAFKNAPQVGTLLKQVRLQKNDDPFLEELHLLSEYFRLGLASGAIIEVGPGPGEIDVHAADQNKELPQALERLVTQLVTLFKFLKSTSLPSGESFWDRTTFVVTSEFSRTMRQPGESMEETGTDHNPLTNSAWVGGRGIRGGQIIGASDFQSFDEVLSAAHLQLDPEGLKTMGKPFDFRSGQVLDPQSGSFDVVDYLSCGNLVNSLYDLFGVPKDQYRTPQRSTQPLPSIPGLLS